MASAAQIKANKQNAKKAGRKKGSLSKTTINRNASLKAFQQKAMEAADVLLNSQLHLATGQTYLYKIEKKRVPAKKKGEVATYIPQKPKLVKNQYEIEQYLMQKFVEGDVDDDHNPAATYYYMTSTKGENKALDSLLDRAYGKSTQVIATEDEDGERKAIEGNVITFASQDGG